jgi:transposase
MGTPVPIRDDILAEELRQLARQESDGRVACRLLGVANALDGMSRERAARQAGMDRQTLRDWVVRYNAKGVAGLHDQPKGHNPEKLTESEQAVLLAHVFRAPDPARDGTCAWTLADLCDFAETRFSKRLSTSGMWGVLQRLGLSHQKARSVHPKSDAKAQAAFQKKGCWTR